MSTTILQLHKRASYEFKFIQDKFAFNASNNSFALADGTTQSFFSEVWASLITQSFVTNPTFDLASLILRFTNLVPLFQETKFEYSSNPAKASLEKTKQQKGSTATFFGLQFDDENKARVISCGDSNLFILRYNKLECFPFNDVDTLDSNSSFINTEQLLQNKIDETYFHSTELILQYDDLIIVASDALSRLLLKFPNVITELTSIKQFEQLHQFCIKYWEQKELQEDDISALIFKIDRSVKIEHVIPPSGFSFPKEIERKFVPAPPKSNLNNYTDMQMQQILQQFNGVANDLREVKKKIKFNEMLLMIAISMIFFLLLFVVYFRLTPASVEQLNRPDTETSRIETLNAENKLLSEKVKLLERKLNSQIATPVANKEVHGLSTIVDTTKKENKEVVKKKTEKAKSNMPTDTLKESIKSKTP